MSPAFFCSYLGKHLRLWQSAGIIPLQSPLPASHVEGLQFNGYRDWKFVHLLLALAPSSSHLSVFLVARKGDTDRRQSRFRGDFRHLPSGRACATHCIVVLITSTIITPSAHGFSQCSQAGFCGFLTFFLLSFFCLIMVPKAEGSILSTQSHSLWEERMSVSGMLTSTKIWDRVFPLTFLAQHPKKYNLATVWLLWGTAYCSWKSIIPTWRGGF